MRYGMAIPGGDDKQMRMLCPGVRLRKRRVRERVKRSRSMLAPSTGRQ
jgi:hypothetical protein